MSKVERKYVVPGDVIAEGDFVPVSNAYSIGNRIYAMRVGLCELEGNKVKVIETSITQLKALDGWISLVLQ